VVPAFFVLLYSIEWGKQKSEEWLTTFLMSVFESILFVDPIMVCNYSVTLNFRHSTLFMSGNHKKITIQSEDFRSCVEGLIVGCVDCPRNTLLLL